MGSSAHAHAQLPMRMWWVCRSGVHALQPPVPALEQPEVEPLRTHLQSFLEKMPAYCLISAFLGSHSTWASSSSDSAFLDWWQRGKARLVIMWIRVGTLAQHAGQRFVQQQPCCLPASCTNHSWLVMDHLVDHPAAQGCQAVPLGCAARPTWRVDTTGKRPTNSGMSPYRIRSACSTCTRDVGGSTTGVGK